MGPLNTGSASANPGPAARAAAQPGALLDPRSADAAAQKTERTRANTH